MWQRSSSVILCVLLLLAADLRAAPEPSITDIDHQWLPDIAGMPQSRGDVATADEVKAAPGGDEPACRKVDAGLRAMVFNHFRNFQAMENHQNVYLDKATTRKWAHVLAMIIKESRGDSTDVTDMRRREVGTYKARTALPRWYDLFSHDHIAYTKQTNYGLAQLSYDRLRATFDLPQTDASRFIDRHQDSKEKAIDLTTARLSRRVIWLYQDFAQGRISKEDARIDEKDIGKPEFQSRYRRGLKEALWHCGTRFLFAEGYQGEDGAKKLEEAMASIAYCKIGSAADGYGADAESGKCFAQWVTLCPAANFDLATINPDRYFQTRKAKPVCLKTFNGMLTAIATNSANGQESP